MSVGGRAATMKSDTPSLKESHQLLDTTFRCAYDGLLEQVFNAHFAGDG